MSTLLKIAQIMLATQHGSIYGYCLCLLLGYATLRILKFSIGVYRLLLGAIEETLLRLNRVLIAARRTIGLFRLFLITWRAEARPKIGSKCEGNALLARETERSGQPRALARKCGRNENRAKVRTTAPGARQAGHVGSFR
jgi:hypothetical protein